MLSLLALQYCFNTQAPHPNEPALPRSALVSGQGDFDASGKRVIFLPDLHVIPGSPQNELAQRVQDFHVEILGSLVDKNLAPALVVENVPTIVTEVQMQADELRIANLTNPYRKSLGTILDRYADHIQVYGTVAPKDWGLMEAYAGRVYDQARKVAIDRVNTFCENSNGGTRLSMAEVTGHVLGGTAAPFEVDCYCDAYDLTQQYVVPFEHDRKVLAPQREAAVARAAQEPLVVVIAGVNHEPEFVRQMEVNRVNYWVVKPKGVVLEPDPIIEPYVDDASGTCAKRVAAQK